MDPYNVIGKPQNNLKLDRRTCKGPCNIGFFSRLAKLTMIILCTVLCVSAAPTVINFDNLVTGGWGTGGPIPVTNQYSAQGVTFNSPVAIDFSKGIAIPGFAHSGTIAIEQCYSTEFCSSPIEMKFNQPQSRVKVWVGIDSQMSGKQEVMLRAYDSSGKLIAQDKKTIDPSAGRVPIQTSLQVSSINPKQKVLTRSSIVRATVSFTDPNTFTNGLAVDDVEFESTGIVATINPVVKAGAY